MTIDELIPSITRLSHAEKIRLVQVVLEQLAEEDAASEALAPGSKEPFDPKRFFGAARHSRQEVDAYLDSAREGWNE
ncbi:MAG TPA: hypothetical protein DDY14_11245 [Chromatiaceae bacterium]|mgnify:CR=1 FL=1|jgi:hypothetical protein|nr:MAG: hypothetical protein N838_19490 [Thiohalocapsa sp. PB-PSB1]QQO53092.1 MAG: hypothetical protein N838_06665 [Thiohalocapsa sp. PB-PSB1]HBG95866.1 hypothetical protein [Chromatiaceae bacterium]HCS88931.1 hypothetical protein [Chromatiaceae bacterium]